MRRESLAAGPSGGRRGNVQSTATVWRAVTRSRLLPSKLEPQRLHVTAVERRLATELAGLRAPLVVISAPAGSGKTIALVQWRNAESRPVAWLHLDAGDNDPVVFVTGMAAALRVTPAELRVLELLPTHLSPQAIADSLCLSHNTVKTHLRAIYRKLGAASRSEAVARARDLGLLRF